MLHAYLAPPRLHLLQRMQAHAHQQQVLRAHTTAAGRAGSLQKVRQHDKYAASHLQ